MSSIIDESLAATHTAGCKFVTIFATSGWRIPSVCYSRQYHAGTNGRVSGSEGIVRLKGAHSLEVYNGTSPW